LITLLSLEAEVVDLVAVVAALAVLELELLCLSQQEILIQLLLAAEVLQEHLRHLKAVMAALLVLIVFSLQSLPPVVALAQVVTIIPVSVVLEDPAAALELLAVAEVEEVETLLRRPLHKGIMAGLTAKEVITVAVAVAALLRLALMEVHRAAEMVEMERHPQSLGLQ
jgi:hypothetical protein